MDVLGEGIGVKVVIAGSRWISFADGVRLVRKALEDCWFTDQITEVIHGNARGIDSAADHVCRPRWPVTPVPVERSEWDRLGKAAGPIRNRKMADMADALIVIWDGESRGSQSMIEAAKAKGLLVFEVRVSRVAKQ